MRPGISVPILAAGLSVLASMATAGANRGPAFGDTGQLQFRTSGEEFNVAVLSSGELFGPAQAINDKQQIVGINLSENCVYVDKKLIQLPYGGFSCSMSSINASGVSVGYYEPKDNGVSYGVIYGDGLNQQVSSASAFYSINDSGMIYGAQSNGLPGIYDFTTGGWTLIADPSTGCSAFYHGIWTDKDSLIAEQGCVGSGLTTFVSISGSQFRYQSVPAPLNFVGASKAKTIGLIGSQCPSHAYLWLFPWKSDPIDLGELPNDKGGCYSITGLNSHNEAIGVSYPSGRIWIWNPTRGMRELNKLANLAGLYALFPDAINDAGDIVLSGATTPSNGDYGSWILLTPK